MFVRTCLDELLITCVYDWQGVCAELLSRLIEVGGHAQDVSTPNNSDWYWPTKMVRILAQFPLIADSGFPTYRFLVFRC